MKKYLFLALVLLPGLCFGEVNKKYSFKDFLNRKFTDVDPKEFNNTEIVGSCFYQESEWDADSLSASPKDTLVDVFPVGMTGVTFKRCNLDNVKIPPGNTVVSDGLEKCTNKRIRVQNDWDDWILDIGSKPMEPMNKEQRLEKEISIDPIGIPAGKMTEEERKQFDNLLNTPSEIK